MRALKQISALFFSLCLTVSMTMPVLAAQQKEQYDYTVRFLSGAQGEFNSSANLTNNGTQSPQLQSGECMVFDGLKAGDRVNFSNGMVTLKDEGKYYVKGIRESGKDNNTVYYLSFTVEGDKDYVVAYGILGDAVAYTINYEDTEGNRLAPGETYYGNVGDRPVVSYLYIEGYQPQAYNLIGRLGENAAENIFTFVYSRVRTTGQGGGGAASTTTTTTGTDAAGGAAAGTGGAAEGVAGAAGTDAGTAAGGTAAGGAAAAAGAAGADAGTDAGADGAAAGAAEAGGEAEDEGPAEMMSVDDEEVPLANGGDVVGESGVKVPTDFAKLIAVPASAKVGIVSALALAAGFGIRFVVLRRRKKEENA